MKKNFYTKIYHTKVSLHENFQIYGTNNNNSSWEVSQVENPRVCPVLTPAVP